MRKIINYLYLFLKKEKTSFINHLYPLLKRVSILFFNYIFKVKFIFFTGILTISYLLIIGSLLTTINIPSSSMDTNFFTNIPIILNYSYVKSLFTLNFALILIAFLIVYMIIDPKKYRNSVLGFFLMAVGGVFLFELNKLSDTDLPAEIYIETTGYPKVVQSGDRNYTLLGSNNMAYDLSKGLTENRCNEILKLNEKSAPYNFYFLLIKGLHDDSFTFPNNAIHLQEENITYIDYNQSRQWVNKQCEKR